MNHLNGLSLFASGGISEYFLDKTKVKIKVANELLPVRCNFYQGLYPKVKIIPGDITDKKIYKNIIKTSKENNVDFIMATPPCQGMSKAGKMNYDDPRNSLFLHIIRICQELKPKYILIENVPEFLKTNYLNENLQSENIMDKINSELGENYNIKGMVLNAKDYQVPQSRNRAIVLFSRKDLKIWDFPKPIQPIITIQDVIGDLPSLESGESLDPKKYKNKNMVKWHYAKTHNPNHILWMSHTPSGETAFNNPIYFPQKDGRKIKGFKTTYKRMAWDKPAPTITMSNGSISSQNNVHPGKWDKTKKIWTDARVLSVYELLLLTSLPYNIKIPEGTSEKLIRELLGECVPSKFMFHLINSIPV